MLLDICNSDVLVLMGFEAVGVTSPVQSDIFGIRLWSGQEK